MVKSYHQKFLESIGITNVDFKEIKRWHPKFDLDSVQEIEESELPKSPNEGVKVKTGQDLLNIAKNVYSSRIQEAIKDFVGNEEASSKKIANVELEIVEKTEKAKETTSISIKASEQTVEKLNLDDKVLAKLKEKKDQSYSALLEKVRFY